MENKQLSLIIVTYNSATLIGEAMESVSKFNDIGDALEIIVVDNASKDFEELESIILKFPMPVKLLRIKKNMGYGSGNNAGIKVASSEVIMIMNPDVTLYQPVFKELINAFKRDNSLGIAGLQQYENLEGVKNHSFIISSLSIWKLLLHKVAIKMNYFNDAYFCFSGACFAIHKSSFEEAGGYNEAVFLYGEESDLQYRVKKKSRRNKVLFFKSLGYIHKVHERSLSIESHLEGVKSFLIIGDTRGISRKRMIEGILNYYKFIQFYNAARKTPDAQFYKHLNEEILKMKELQ